MAGLLDPLRKQPGMLGSFEDGSAALDPSVIAALRALPEAVRNSILNQPSYAEGQQGLNPVPQAQRNVYEQEMAASPGIDYRTAPLTQALGMRDYLKRMDAIRGTY